MASSHSRRDKYQEEHGRQQDLAEQGPAALINAQGAGGSGEGAGEDGINPYIPMYIAKTPWYMSASRTEKEKIPTSLAHQRKANDQSSMDQWYDRTKVTAQPAATKFRKGACENCGAISHKTKDCVERPRKKGAKWTNADIRPDERIESVDLSFEAKRDRWNGYDPAQQKRHIDEWNKVEEERRRLKEQEDERKREAENAAKAATEQALKVGGSTEGPSVVDEVEDDLDALSDSDGDEKEDEYKYADKAQSIGQEVDAKSRITVRNLRIREDTAKYLKPETLNIEEEGVDDNFVKASQGEAAQFSEVQTFSWEAAERGLAVHVQADPTRAEFMHKKHTEEQKEANRRLRKEVLERYGGEEYLKSVPKELVVTKEEHLSEIRKEAVEAKKHVVGASGKNIVRSKYPEDQFEKFGKGHTTVWGSYYDTESHKWGYACCRNTYKNAFCTGSAGIQADQEKIVRVAPETTDKSLQQLHLEKMVENINQKRKQVEEE